METELTDQIVIHAPVAEVWNYIVRMDLWRDWYAGLHDVEDLSGLGNQPGITFSAQLDIPGLPTQSFDAVITEVDERRRWQVLTTGMLSSTTTWEFEERGRWTNVDVHVDYTVTGAVGVVADALFVRRNVRRGLARSLNSLKRNVELRPVRILGNTPEAPWLLPSREEELPASSEVRRVR